MSSFACGDQPMFIVGSGRSGTTILYDILCTHPEASWFSTLSEKAPRIPQTAALSNLYRIDRLRRRRPRWLPVPSEGYPLWDDIARLPADRVNAPLTEEEAEPGAIRRFQGYVYQHQRWQRKHRFINKNTRNTRRIRYLNRLAPESLFIHVVRDPRPAVASLVRVPWWQDLPLWTRGGSTPRSLADVPDSQLAAELWRAEVERALSDKEVLDPERYAEVRYEELISDPWRVLSELTSFCRLRPSDTFRRSVSSFVLTNQNEGFRSRLRANDLRIVELETRSAASALDYVFED